MKTLWKFKRLREFTDIRCWDQHTMPNTNRKKKDPPKDKTISNLLMFPNLAIAFIPIVVIRVTFYNQYFLKRFETMIEM